MDTSSLNQILSDIELKEKKAKKRAIAFTFIPLVFAILLISYTTYELRGIEVSKKEANNELQNIKIAFDSVKIENRKLQSINDSLSKKIAKVHELLGKQVSYFSELEDFAKRMKLNLESGAGDPEFPPELRTNREAALWINYRMLGDKLRGNYDDLSKDISKLPELPETYNWIVIVESSTSLEDLKKETGKLISFYGKEQIAIYEVKKGNFALSVKGNGTFTRAYRLNVELRDKYGYKGAFFSRASDWGVNYLGN